MSVIHRLSSVPVRGFTIVELLIVIVVIGILAAIVIVAYNGIQNRALDTSVTSDLVNFHKKMELFKTTDSNSIYPDTVPEMQSLGVKFNTKGYSTVGSVNLLYCVYDSGKNYALETVSKTNKKYYISSASAGAVKEYPGAGAWLSGSWATSCSLLESIESFGVGTAAGGLPGGTSGTSDFGASGGYWNTVNRSPAWHAWTGN